MFVPMQPETTTIRGRLRRVVTVARRELRSPPPATWKRVDRRGENERFSNRVVLVTGTAGLIGYLLVQAFIDSGAIVHAVDINGDGFDRLVTEVSSAQGADAAARLRTSVVDVGDTDQISNLATSVDELDVLVNNVGYNDNTTDLSHQLAERGIRVNAVAPGLVRNYDDEPDRRATSGGALAGGAVPVDAIAHAVRFLCDSRVSPMTTGQHLVIDGGAGMYRSGVHNEPLEQW